MIIDFNNLQLQLSAEDSHSWNCTQSCQVLQSASPSDWSIYLDGSATGKFFGSATVVSTPSQTHALASSSPLHSSFGAEFWALVTALRHLSYIRTQAPQPVHIYGDNQAVVDLFYSSHQHTTISTHPRGSEIKFLQSVLPELHPRFKISMIWIKSHVGFQGNELADSIAKWAAFLIPAPTLPLPPKSMRQFGFFSCTRQDHIRLHQNIGPPT